MSLDVFGLALQPSFLHADHKHELVASIVSRNRPSLEKAYPGLRQRAEEKARAVAASKELDEVAVSTINDHLCELLIDCLEPDEAAAIARFATETELELGRVLGRPNPDTLELHRVARERGIATAMVADSCLPRDLVARIVRASGFKPDFVVVSSNEGKRKGSGLYQRLLAKAGLPPESVVHFGPDQQLDVDVPRDLGIAAYLAPSPRSRPAPEVLLDLNPPRGLDSLALTVASAHLDRTGAGNDDGYDLGYYAAGPMLAGFSSWLGSVIAEAEPDHVLLCGPAGELLHRGLDIVMPDLPADRRHVLPPAGDGRCPVDRLAGTVPLRKSERVLVAALGLFDEPHRYAEKVLNAEGSGPIVTGAYLGLAHAPDDSATVWAFDDADTCPVREAAFRRPEVLQALLHFMPDAAQDLSPGLRPFHGMARGVARGAEAFVEDVEPWLHLDARGLSPTMLEPALRVLTNPTSVEAQILAPYPLRGVVGADGATPLANLPPRSQAARHPSIVDEWAELAPWTEGYRALAQRRSGPLRSRARRRLRS